MPDRYTTLLPSIVGSNGNWSTDWHWDGSYFDRREDAVTRGFTYERCDDFAIGVIDPKTRRLRAIEGLHGPREQSAHELLDANEQLGLPRGPR
jgi:hypothetical protein